MARLSASVLLPILNLLLLFHYGVAEEMSCCAMAAGSCRSVCSKLSLVSLGSDPYARDNATRVFSEFCSTELVEFWTCVNTTIEEVKRHENWTGRSCCRLARNPLCRANCAQAGSPEDLKNCRWSDEPQLADCLEQRADAESCCASVTNVTCRAHCTELFHDHTSRQSALKAYGSKGCFHQVPKCLKSVAETKATEDPKLYLHCCEQASTPSCLESCRRALHTSSAIHDMLDALEEPCGPIMPHSPLWGCFLKSASPSSGARPQRLPLNAAKLSCCTRASRRGCQSLCWRAFHTDWSAWQQLESTCLSSSLENELRRCLEEAEDSCEIGCAGLSFCSNFNDRPTTLFRTCTAAADDSAKWELDHWLRGGIISGLGVPVRAAASCPATTLRAAACLLQLRPCESRIHETRLCREDCIELMTSCVDWSAVQGHNAATLCSKLSPPKPGMPCVSIKPFLEDPREQNEPPLGIDEDINVPCKNNPCSAGKICVIHHRERRNYRCVPGCPLGEMSKQLIPVGAWAQIPRAEHQGCYRICQCSNHGSLEKCRDLNCPAATTCWVQNSFVAHRTSFYLECKPCRCFEGEVTCSRKSCAEVRYSTLPCDCPSHYVPVCGRLGVTYASACLAKCAGLLVGELEYNSCSKRRGHICGTSKASDPGSCKPNETCFARPKVCLSPIHKPCEQHECIRLPCDPRSDKRATCKKCGVNVKPSTGPVCDKKSHEHPSLCSLAQRGAQLAYWGHCQQRCSTRGKVCGINGEEYDSECAAWADRTVVDYQGECIAVGLIGDQPKPRCADAVACPPLARQNCIGVTPPGACCPVCGGAARLFYSKKQHQVALVCPGLRDRNVAPDEWQLCAECYFFYRRRISLSKSPELDRIYYQLPDDSDKRIVTLEAMLDGLSRQLKVAECVLRGKITLDGDIFVLNQPVSKRPSELQLSACVAEIEKLVSRIADRSPKIVAEVPLSSLTWAEVVHSRVASNGAMTAQRNIFTLVGLAALVVRITF